MAPLVVALGVAAFAAPLDALEAPPAHPADGSRHATRHAAIARAFGADEPLAWRRLADGPPRAGHVAVLDAPRRRVLVLGGEEGLVGGPAPDVALDLGGPPTWRSLGLSGPPPRARQVGRGVVAGAAVVDEGEGLLAWRCDCAGGSTRLLELETDRWRPPEPDDAPPLVGGAMGYDATRDRAVHVGGDWGGLGALSASVASLDLGPRRRGWATLGTAPFTLAHQAAAMDAASGRMLAFGGQDADGLATGDLWLGEPEGANLRWRRVAPSPGGAWPEPRLGASLTPLGGFNRALLFGGYAPEAEAPPGPWLLALDGDRATWRPLESDGAAPGPRAAHVALWDEAGARVLLHGGHQDGGGAGAYLGDTWALELGGVADPRPILLPRLDRLP